LLIIGILQLLLGPEAPGMTFYNLQLLNKYLERPVDVLIFSDSTDWYTADNDKDKRSISRMLKDLLPHKNVKNISHAAYHLDIYRAFCQYLVKNKNPPELIIIPLNLRSFSPQWDMEPYYQFEKEKIILDRGVLSAFYKPLRILKVKFNKINREAYLKLPVFKGDEKIGEIRDMKGLKDQFIIKYMYPLSLEHRKIKSLLKIAGLLSSHQIDALFYITPVDYQAGEEYLPGEFIKRVTRNTGIIKDLLAQEHMSKQLLDLSLDLGSDCFAWKKPSPNEHLNQKGRKYVAEKLYFYFNKD